MENKIPVLIACRLGSSRLPRKALLEMPNGQCVLDLVIERIRASEFVSEIVIATTNNKEDDELIKYAQKNNIKIFRGSENNVAERIYECAKKFGISHFFEVLGDNPFIDPRFFQALFELVEKKINLEYASFLTYEYPSDSRKRFPIGVRVQYVRTEAMKKILETNNAYFFEHATSYFYDKVDGDKVVLLEPEEDLSIPEKMNFAVNTKEDWLNMITLNSNLLSTDWEELVHLSQFLKLK